MSYCGEEPHSDTGGDAVANLMLPQLEPMLAPTAPWASRHAALIAIATVCEHAASTIEPHLGHSALTVRAYRTAGALGRSPTARHWPARWTCG